MEVRQIGNVMPTKSRDNPNQGRVYSTDGLCPALTKMDGGGRQPMIIETVAIKQATAKGYIECEVGGWQISLIPQAKHEEGEYRIWVE